MLWRNRASPTIRSTARYSAAGRAADRRLGTVWDGHDDESLSRLPNLPPQESEPPKERRHRGGLLVGCSAMTMTMTTRRLPRPAIVEGRKPESNHV